MNLPATVVVLALLAGLGTLAPAAHAEAATPKRILIVYDEDKDSLPGLGRIDRGLRETFRARLGSGLQIHSESLALSQFDRAGYESDLAEFYRRKYADSTPDLIVAVLEPSLNFLLRHADTLFPGVPIVFSGVDSSAIEGRTLPRNVTGVLVKRAYSPTLEVVRRLQPQVRSVFVVPPYSERAGESRLRRHSDSDRTSWLRRRPGTA